jgi:hypothetical protein
MWTKLKIVEPIDYVQGEVIEEYVGEEDGIIWTRQYSVEVNFGSLGRVINVINRNMHNYRESIIEFLLEEDQGNIHAPPCTRALTNLDNKNCIIDFYYENPGANVYFAREDLVLIHHTDFNLNWSVVLEPNETIIIDGTLPTRIKYAKKLLWREWVADYEYIRDKFTAWIETDSDKKEQDIIQGLVRQGLNPTSPVIIKQGGITKYTKMPPTIVFN